MSKAFSDIDENIKARANNFMRRLDEGIITLNRSKNKALPYKVDEADESAKSFLELPESDTFIIKEDMD